MFDMIYREPSRRRFRSWNDDFLGNDFWNFSSLMTNQKETSPFSVKTLEEDGETFTEVRLVAPGLKREDFSVEIEDRNITIGYNVETKQEYNYASRSATSTYILPDGVKPNEVKANYKDGILYVRIPQHNIKKPEVESLKVQIE